MKYIYTTILFLVVAILYGVYTNEVISLTLDGPPQSQNIKDYARSKVGEEQWKSFNNIIQHESQWRDNVKNPNSSAFGLCQTMMSLYEDELEEDFRTNPYAQIDWCISYASLRYGSPNKAWQFWQQNKYW